jgi:hypothetical protein
VLDRLRRDPGGFRGLLDVDAGHGVAEPLVRHALIDHHAEDRERQQSFGPGDVANPLVGVRRG